MPSLQIHLPFVIAILAILRAHRSQLGSKIFIDEHVDEEIGHVVDVERETEVATNWFRKDDDVQIRCVRQNVDEQQTQTDLYRFHVRRSMV